MGREVLLWDGDVPEQEALELLRCCLVDERDFVMWLLLAPGHRLPLMVPSQLTVGSAPIGSGGVHVCAPCPHPSWVTEGLSLFFPMALAWSLV